MASLEIFNNPAYAGRLSIPDNVDDAYALAYLATGVTDWRGVTDAEFEAATEWLRGIHPNLLNYWVDPAELQQLMASGQILAAWAWNEVPRGPGRRGLSHGLRTQHRGRHIGLALRLREHGRGRRLRGSGLRLRQRDAVGDFGRPASGERFFGSANAAALEALGAEAMEAAGLGVVEVPVLAQLPISNEQRERQAEAFERIKAGF